MLSSSLPRSMKSKRPSATKVLKRPPISGSQQLSKPVNTVKITKIKGTPGFEEPVSRILLEKGRPRPDL